MRILHTADWHLGKKSEGRDRLPEQKRALEAMVSLCEAQKVDFVAVAGDVFDTYTPSAEAEDLFYLALTELSAGGRRAVFVIAGNHDDPTRLAAARELGYRHNVFLIEHPGQVLRQEQDFALRLKDSAPGSALFQKGEEALAVGFLPYPSEERMGLPLYLAAVVVFGTRLFQNFGEIRRELLTSRQKGDKIEQDIVPDRENSPQ